MAELARAAIPQRLYCNVTAAHTLFMVSLPLIQ